MERAPTPDRDPWRAAGRNGKMMQTRSLGILASLMTLGLFAQAARAEQLAYVRASSQLDEAVNPTRYHPINLLDHNPKTLWCEGAPGSGEGQQLTFVFKEAVVIDRIVLVAASEGRLVESVRLSDGFSSVRLKVTGDTVDQVLTTPLKGTTYTLTLEHVGQAQAGSVLSEDVTCLADMNLYHGTQAISVSRDHGLFDANREHIVGAWQAAPLGASESSLTFAVDGTWSWEHTPLAGGASKRAGGAWKTQGSHVLMRKGANGRFVDVGLHSNRVVIDPQAIGAPAGDYDVITLNEALGKEFAGEYNNAQF